MAVRDRLGYLPALDGVRAAAVIAVILHHAGVLRLHGGGLVGVESFFVLSGFLITALLVGERAGTGAISLRSFYARRALRLFPALFATVAAVGIYTLVEHDPASRGAIPGVLFYVANWSQAMGRPLGLLSHTWSLAIEEQFYLLWPALVAVIATRTRNPRVLGVTAFTLALVSTVVRVRVAHSDVDFLWVRNGFDTRAAGLLFGCALAVVIMGRRSVPPVAVALGPWIAVAGAVVLVAMCRTTVNARWGYGWGLSVVQLGALALIGGLVAAPAAWPARWFSVAPLRWIGQRSYGLYLWHFPVFRVVGRHTHLGHALTVAFEVVVAVAVAALSYRVIEQPALRLKSRFATAPATQPA